MKTYQLPGTLRSNCCSDWNSLCIVSPFHISRSNQRLRDDALELNCTWWLYKNISISKYSNFWYWNEIEFWLAEIFYYFLLENVYLKYMNSYDIYSKMILFGSPILVMFIAKSLKEKWKTLRGNELRHYIIF